MQTLIFHMHGLGDMIMFLPTFNHLPNKKKSIDLLVFENNSVLPLIESKKIRTIYYCNSSYFKLFIHLIFLFFKKFENIYFSHNFSPLKSIMISIFLRGKKISILSEKKIFIKPTKIEIKYVKKKLHKIFRNLSLINQQKKTKFQLNTSLHFKKRRNSKYKKRRVKLSVGIHPGSNIKNGDKRWDIQKYLELIKFFQAKNINVHIFIGEYEKELFSNFNLKLKNVRIIYKKSFNYVANLIEQLDFFISNETGLAHLSSSLSVKTLVIINKKNDREKTDISLPFINTIFIESTNDKKDLKKIFNYFKNKN